MHQGKTQSICVGCACWARLRDLWMTVSTQRDSLYIIVFIIIIESHLIMIKRTLHSLTGVNANCESGRAPCQYCCFLPERVAGAPVSGSSDWQIQSALSFPFVCVPSPASPPAGNTVPCCEQQASSQAPQSHRHESQFLQHAQGGG